MRNQKGQSLVGLMVTLGIMSIMTLGTIRLMTNMTLNNSTAQANSDITGYLNTIRNNVSDPTLATVTLAGNALTSTAINFIDPLNSPNLIGGAGYKQQANDPWQVKGIQFYSTTPVPSRTGLYRISIAFVFQKDPARTIGPSVSRRIMGDVFCMAPAGIITTCLGAVDTQTLAMQTCVSMGGTWNATAGTCGIAPVVVTPTPAPVVVTNPVPVVQPVTQPVVVTAPVVVETPVAAPVIVKIDPCDHNGQ